MVSPWVDILVQQEPLDQFAFQILCAVFSRRSPFRCVSSQMVKKMEDWDFNAWSLLVSCREDVWTFLCLIRGHGRLCAKCMLVACSLITTTDQKGGCDWGITNIIARSPFFHSSFVLFRLWRNILVKKVGVKIVWVLNNSNAVRCGFFFRAGP